MITKDVHATAKIKNKNFPQIRAKFQNVTEHHIQCLHQQKKKKGLGT